jgi:hypothetical protein
VKAIRTLRELDHAGTPVTFESVARAAGVSTAVRVYVSLGTERPPIERLIDERYRQILPVEIDDWDKMVVLTAPGVWNRSEPAGNVPRMKA